MATRSSSNRGLAKGMTYGKGKELLEQIEATGGLPQVTGRNNNVPPPAVNTLDNTRRADTATENAEIVANTVTPVTPVAGRPVVNNFDVLRDVDNAESPTFGASPVSLTPEEIGDMDYDVLADLAINTEVSALREILGL